jgi:hypothetical protein
MMGTIWNFGCIARRLHIPFYCRYHGTAVCERVCVALAFLFIFKF